MTAGFYSIRWQEDQHRVQYDAPTRVIPNVTLVPSEVVSGIPADLTDVTDVACRSYPRISQISRILLVSLTHGSHGSGLLARGTAYSLGWEDASAVW